MPKSKEFVSSSETDSDSDSEPKSKKKKPEKRKREEAEEDTSDAGKKKLTKNAAGEYSFELSKNRFASVSEFRGKIMVGIREFYEKDGKLLPGKKGISLQLEQWEKLKKNIDSIDEAIRELS